MRVAIVGAGISGLALAHWLRRHPESPADVTVLDGAGRAGGLIRTDRIGGYLCEQGANGFLDRAPDTFALIESLGLGPRVVPGSEWARRRFVFRNGRLHLVPTGLGAFLRSDLLSLRGRLRIALEPFVRRGSAGDESVHQFAARRFGREVADVMVDAFTTGVFGGPARDLSLRACFPQLWQLERDHGGVVRGMLRGRTRPPAAGSPSPFGRLVSLAGGMEEIVAALGHELSGVLKLETAVERIERRSGTPQPWVLHTARGSLAADHVVLATTAAAAARLTAPIDPELASLLAGIRTAPLAVLCLGFDPAARDAALDGFGFLVPRGEAVRILGAVWDSSVFPGRCPPGHTLVRVIIGGGRDPEAVSLDDAELVRIARRDLEAACRITSAPSFVHLVRHVPGLPQYAVGHVERMEAIEARLEHYPGLLLTGNSYHGLAVNACITNARRMADRLVAGAA